MWIPAYFRTIKRCRVIEALKDRAVLPDNSVLLTFDDGYIDSYTVAFPILEEFGFQDLFFIPGKTFTMHHLLDVNKIHYVLASADIGKLMVDVKEKMDYYRGQEFNYPSADELWNQYAKERNNRVPEWVPESIT